LTQKLTRLIQKTNHNFKIIIYSFLS